MKIFRQNICRIREKVIILQPKTKKTRIMSMLNAYFYGYYFYFTSNCEAGSCV